MAYGFSAVLPLQRDDEDGFYSLTKTLNDNIRQNVKNILLTSPGERVMMADFGVGIRSFLFEIDSFENQNKISRRIREQLNEYMSFVQIDSIEFSTDNEMIIGIRLFYSVPSINFSDLFEIIKPVL